MILDPTQEAAVTMALAAPISVITGGPGTGKSTCLRELLDRAEAAGERALLAAPTGKAARRMAEATGREAKTIHRMLGWTPHGFAHNPANPLDADLVCIDESSMVDTALAESLFLACDPRRSRLVLIGDVDQLPSVGPGRVLADIIDSNAVPVTRLMHLHRAAAESWVNVAAQRVLAGKMPELEERHDFEFVECATAEDAAIAAADIAALRLAPVLAPKKDHTAGVHDLNARIQRRVNPGGAVLYSSFGTEIRAGDQVIQTRNNYDLDVMNGEVGAAQAPRIEGGEQVLEVNFGDGRAVAGYSKEDAGELALAYALTTHRSQGSEWPWVIVLAHSCHAFMLSRQLFYTAITRAKRGIVIVGDRKGISGAVRKTKDSDRHTALRERISAEMKRAAGGE